MENTLTIQLKFQLHNLYKANASTKPDRDGVIKPSKWQLQYLDVSDGAEGQRMDIGKVSLPLDITDDKLEYYKKNVGKEVTIDVKAFANDKRQIVFYGV